MDERLRAVNGLERWLRDEAPGAVRAVRVARQPVPDLSKTRELGCVAQKRIDTGDVLISMPKLCIVCIDTLLMRSKQQRLLKAALKAELEQRKAENWAASPAEERYQANVRLLAQFIFVDSADPDSVFAPYYAALPVRYEALPCCWGPRDFELLEGSFRSVVVRQRAVMVQSWLAHISPLLSSLSPNADWITFERWEWALCTVWSRSYLSRKDLQPLLVPTADMFNQAPLAKHTALSAYVFDGLTFELSVNSHYEPGDEVFVSYGDRAQADFAFAYGVVLPRPRHPRVEVLLLVPLSLLEPADVIYARKRELLKELGIPVTRSVSIAFDFDGDLLPAVPLPLLTFLRVLALSSSEIASARRTVEIVAKLKTATANDILSPSHELSTLHLLQQCVAFSREELYREAPVTSSNQPPSESKVVSAPREIAALLSRLELKGLEALSTAVEKRSIDLRNARTAQRAPADTPVSEKTPLGSQ